jgi:thymidylate kinase
MKTHKSNIPRVIIFFGPDGSGKTTQAKLLSDQLKSRGFSVKKIWMRSVHTLAFLISRIAQQFLKLNDVYEFRSKYVRHSNLWYLLEFVSIIPLIFFSLYLPLLRGHIVVADRFVIDWIVSIAYWTHNPSFIHSRWAGFALRLIPKDAIMIYIDAEYQVLSSRRQLEESFDYINFQRTCYIMFAEELDAAKVDTSNKNIQEVNEIILKLCNAYDDSISGRQ